MDKRPVLILVPFLVACSILTGQPARVERSSIALEVARFTLMAADFDGDGDDEVAVREDGTMAIYRHTAAGSFDLQSRWDLEMGHRGGVRALALDTDAFADVVRGNLLSLTVTYGRGDGGFDDAIDVPARDEVRHFALDDFDADGLDDIVYCGGEPGVAGLMLALPERGFAAAGRPTRRCSGCRSELGSSSASPGTRR